MANPRRKRRSSRRSSNSHRRRHRKSNPAVRFGRSHRRYGRRRRSNPSVAGFSAISLLKMGAGSAIGGLLTGKLTDMVLGVNNVGFVGYAGDAAATAAVGLLANKFAGKEVATGVFAGGVAQLLLRVWQDYGGQIRSAIGLGEYVSSQFPLPTVSQRVGAHYLTPAPVMALPSPKAKTLGRVSRFQSRFQ